MLLSQEEFQRANEAELQRLITKGLTSEEEILARRYYSDKERQGMDESDFCGPHKSFPIKTAADVSNAAHLIGHADDLASVKACIIRKAKANGWALPDAWKEEKQEDRIAPSDSAVFMSAPITRIDKDHWIIEGIATDDQIDTFGTIFDYESSKKAFEKWRGNIREMHKNEAVGHAIEWAPDDANRSIFLRARISKGAPNTWAKICDGTLSGFSISIPPERYKTRMIERNGKRIPYYYDHELAEVSVVDNPGNVNCNFALVRADGLTTELLDTTEEETDLSPSSASSSPLARAGARVSGDTRAAMHKGIAHTLHAAVSQMQNCGCDSCMAAQKMIDPDGDGDIDIGSFDDPDQDADDLYNGRDADMSRSIETLVERIVTAQMAPVYARLQGIAGTLARNIAPSNNEAITRAMESSLAEVRASLGAVKEQVEKIANTPMPGYPIMNTGAIPKPPIEKRLPTDPYQPLPRSGSSVYDALARMSEQGELDTLERQTDAIAAGLLAQRRGL